MSPAPRTWPHSLRAAGVTADAAAVRITLSGEVQEVADEPLREPADGGPQPLSEAELAEFTASWEVWDAYLAQILTALAGRVLSEADRQVLLDVLLTTRHAFLQGLTENSLSGDFVRTPVRPGLAAAWRGFQTLPECGAVVFAARLPGFLHGLRRADGAGSDRPDAGHRRQPRGADPAGAPAGRRARRAGGGSRRNRSGAAGGAGAGAAVGGPRAAL